LKAAQIVSHRKFDIVDVDTPDISSEPQGTVLVKSYQSAICGSDMPLFDLKYPEGSYPLSLGRSIHECIGTIASSNSNRFDVGDMVLSIPREFGLSEYFVSNENVTVPLPDKSIHSYEMDHILMSQPLGTVIWACRKLGNLLHQDTVIVGQGPMGLLFSHMLSNLGVSTIIAVDQLDYRLSISKQMRATHVINSKKENPVEIVKDITNGKMADLVVEMVGHQTETINDCLDLVKRGGTILAFGVPDDNNYNFRYGDFFRRNIHLISTVGPEELKDYPLAMDFIVQGRINVSPIITHHLPFTEVQCGFDLFSDRQDEAIKVVLDFD
tara:strand:- start:364 stop:1338 length:975 start_codon:yes stop_codon:yes gene_type:complete